MVQVVNKSFVTFVVIGLVVLVRSWYTNFLAYALFVVSAVSNAFCRVLVNVVFDLSVMFSNVVGFVFCCSFVFS